MEVLNCYKNAQNIWKLNRLISDTTMEKTSDHWTSFKDLNRESEHAQKIIKVLNIANFVYLRSVALQARYDEDLKSNIISTSQSQRLTCTIDESQFAVGHNNIVFEIAFSDASQWIARVRLPDDKSNERDLVETSIMSEIATIQSDRLENQYSGPENPQL